jgi:CHAT domain-containing protein
VLLATACTGVAGAQSWKAYYDSTQKIASMHLRQGAATEAIENYVEVLEICKQWIPETDPLFIMSLNNLAEAYAMNNQYHQTYVHLRWAYELVQISKMENEAIAATILNNLATFYTYKGDLESAVDSYEKAYCILSGVYGEESVMLKETINNMALAYWALGEARKAVPLFKRALELSIKEIRYVFPAMSESEQMLYYKKLKENFEKFNSVAIQWEADYPELLVQMFDHQMIIKSLMFSAQQQKIMQKKDTALQPLLKDLWVKQEQLGYLYKLPKKEVASQGFSLSALEEEITVLEKSLQPADEMTAAEDNHKQGFTWINIHDHLQQQEAFVTMVRFHKFESQWKEPEPDASFRIRYGLTDRVYYAALVAAKDYPSGPQLVVFDDGVNMETRFLNYFRNALRFDVADENSYAAYWKPLEHLLADKKRIYFSGDGVYHKLNLNTLREPETNEYLLERYELHLLSDPVQFLVKHKQTSSELKEAVLIGDPDFDAASGPETGPTTNEKFLSLPGTNEEVASIDKVLRYHNWQTSVYLKNAASERNLRNVSSPSVLHLATYGLTSPETISTKEINDNPGFTSGIILSGANKNLEGTGAASNDGIVTPYELVNLALSGTQLVVLSVCEAAAGKVENEESAQALQQAFLQAGARNVLISLWKTDPSFTTEFMSRFYEYLSLGTAARTALRLAQLEQLKENGNPRLWGSFVMVGVD